MLPDQIIEARAHEYAQLCTTIWALNMYCCTARSLVSRWANPMKCLGQRAIRGIKQPSYDYDVDAVTVDISCQGLVNISEKAFVRVFGLCDG